MKAVVSILALSIFFIGALRAEESREFKGWYVGARVLDYNSDSNASVYTGLGYWDEFWGFTAGVGFKDSAFKIDGERFTDSSLWGIDASLRAAYPVVDRVKTYFELGLSYMQVSALEFITETRGIQLTPTLAIDFLAADHLILGLNVISVPWFVYGRVKPEGSNEVKFDRHSISLFNGISIAYLF